MVELRQYTLRAAARETLVELFEREFVESQEAVGASVIGTFRDLDDPDRFVWLRGFADMPARELALASFYAGPVWNVHRDAANATMVDSDNVLLLRPAWPGAAFGSAPASRPAAGSAASGGALFVARIYAFDAPVEPSFAGWFRREAIPFFRERGASNVAVLATEETENNFPALPVREGEHVLVWVARFDDQAAYEQFIAAMRQSRRWNGELLPVLRDRLREEPALLRWAPTARSLLR